MTWISVTMVSNIEMFLRQWPRVICQQNGFDAVLQIIFLKVSNFRVKQFLQISIKIPPMFFMTQMLRCLEWHGLS